MDHLFSLLQPINPAQLLHSPCFCLTVALTSASCLLIPFGSPNSSFRCFPAHPPPLQLHATFLPQFSPITIQLIVQTKNLEPHLIPPVPFPFLLESISTSLPSLTSLCSRPPGISHSPSFQMVSYTTAKATFYNVNQKMALPFSALPLVFPSPLEHNPNTASCLQVDLCLPISRVVSSTQPQSEANFHFSITLTTSLTHTFHTSCFLCLEYFFLGFSHSCCLLIPQVSKKEKLPPQRGFS